METNLKTTSCFTDVLDQIFHNSGRTYGTGGKASGGYQAACEETQMFSEDLSAAFDLLHIPFLTQAQLS